MPPLSPESSDSPHPSRETSRDFDGKTSNQSYRSPAFGQLLRNLYEARFLKSKAIARPRWKLGDQFHTKIGTTKSHLSRRKQERLVKVRGPRIEKNCFFRRWRRQRPQAGNESTILVRPFFYFRSF